MNERAITYRRLHDIPDHWMTAVNVQAMVFGNLGETSATGVAFTRNPSTGDNEVYGEFLVNAQGEDVVAGIRTPQQISLQGSRDWAEAQGISEEERARRYPSLEEAMPEMYEQFLGIVDMLEHHYEDMQDMEFTIERGKLWMLQTRTGKRTAASAVKIAVDLVEEDHRVRVADRGQEQPVGARRRGGDHHPDAGDHLAEGRTDGRNADVEAARRGKLCYT